MTKLMVEILLLGEGIVYPDNAFSELYQAKELPFTGMKNARTFVFFLFWF